MSQPIKIDPWKRGDPLDARHLDQPRKALELILQGGADPAGRRAAAGMLARFAVVTVAGDYLTCNRLDGLGNAATTAVNVAKPYLLRNSMTARGSATYSYSATDTREATVGGDTEDQVVVPSYIAGDEIFAYRLPQGGTGVDGAPLWLDANSDARAWAKASE